MAIRPTQHVVLVHGYSETSLGTYYRIPDFLGADRTVVLSAFDSLDDHVTIDDLADALERRVGDLAAERPNWDIRDTAFVCHSTGALVTRRWLMNRFVKLKAAKPEERAGLPQIPCRIVTMAGANHGSSLAEIGKSPVGYLQKFFTKHQVMVGKRVLTDLTYGSDFLLRLNREWLEAWNDPAFALGEYVLPFSLGGDWISNDLKMKLFWGTQELGSDNTVRISGANLNYSVVEADVTSGRMVRNAPNRRVAHRIVPGKSHFDDTSGILAAPNTADEAFVMLQTALNTDDAGYDALAAKWDADNRAWMAGTHRGGGPNSAHTNSTLVFNLTDRGKNPIDDCMIAFWDQATLGVDPRGVHLGGVPMRMPVADVPVPAGPETDDERAARDNLMDRVLQATLTSSEALVGGTPGPIHNDVQRGSYSFYVNQPTWRGGDPNGPRMHAVYIESLSDSPYIGYTPIIYETTSDDEKLVQPNETTYVFITLDRDTDAMFTFYGWEPAFDYDTRRNVSWRPFPADARRIPPAPKPSPPKPPV